jgi:pimeloyl-ACP methyl ester carboxylesterase
VQLACDDVGGGECVVLIHGHPFDRTLWEPQLAALHDSFRVLAPDLRGLGYSPVVPGCVLMREYAADIEDLLDRLGITRAAVLGLSMGGLVAGQPMRADTHLGQRVGGAADIAKVTAANLVQEAVTWGIRRRVPRPW